MTLFYLCSPTNRAPIHQYICGWGSQHLPYVLPLTYDSLLTKRHFPKGTYVFSDMDYVSLEMLERLQPVWETLTRSGARVLNRPGKTMRRLQLLQGLHARGSNHFNAYRLTDDLSRVRFPAFVRRENDHFGARSGLLQDAAALQGEVARLRAKNADLSAFMVSEFCDTRDERGVIRKYSSFRIGKHVIPRHVFFASDEWQLKNAVTVDAETIREETEYVQQNPHAAELLEIFDFAGADYGRIDYAIKDGKIQVWEINTNPLIIASENQDTTKARFSIHHLFKQRVDAVLRELHGNDVTALSPEYARDALRLLAQYGIAKAGSTKLGPKITQAQELVERLRKRKGTYARSRR